MSASAAEKMCFLICFFNLEHVLKRAEQFSFSASVRSHPSPIDCRAGVSNCRGHAVRSTYNFYFIKRKSYVYSTYFH